MFFHSSDFILICWFHVRKIWTAIIFKSKMNEWKTKSEDWTGGDLKNFIAVSLSLFVGTNILFTCHVITTAQQPAPSWLLEQGGTADVKHKQTHWPALLLATWRWLVEGSRVWPQEGSRKRNRCNIKSIRKKLKETTFLLCQFLLST